MDTLKIMHHLSINPSNAAEVHFLIATAALSRENAVGEVRAVVKNFPTIWMTHIVLLRKENPFLRAETDYTATE